MPRAARPPMTRRRSAPGGRELQLAGSEVLAELAACARSADEHYRAAAEQIGRLYMSADAHRLAGLTRRLDEPMRRAAEVQRSFAGLWRDLQDCLRHQAAET